MNFKLKKRMIAATMAILITCIPISVSASQEINKIPQTSTEVSPRFSYISTATSNISCNSGVITATSNLTGKYGITDKVDIYSYLQKYNYLTNKWDSIANWYKTFYGYYGYFSNQTPVSSGTYRVFSSFYAYSGSSSEHHTNYSKELIY